MMVSALVIGGLMVMVLVMTASWMFQKAIGNAGWTDVFWTLGTGACGVSVALWADRFAFSPRQAIVAALVAAWSLRLGIYVALRVAGSPHEDPRYLRMRQDHGVKFQAEMFKLSLVQPPATALLLISIALAAHERTPWLRVTDIVGILILVVAIGGEALADAQMKKFKTDPSAKGKVMDRGLWGWSRHPNYFFEWLGWVAYPVIATNLYNGWSWASLIAPVVMYQVLTKLTGIPPTEAAMLRSKGEPYRRYQASVSAFFPLPPKERAAT